MVVAGLSEHPDPVEATAEVVGRALDEDEPQPDLAMLFVSPQHRDAFAEIAATVRAALQPGRLVGVTASGVVGGSREIEDGPAVALWAARLGGVPEAVRLTATATASGAAVQGLPHTEGDGGDDDPTGRGVEGDGRPRRVMMVLADPFSVPLGDILDVLAARPATLPVIGGLASAATGPGGNRLVLDDRVYTDGAVGVLLEAGAAGYEVVVSQGCRPIGSPMIVTKADGSQLLELAGQPAVARLTELAGQISPDERTLLAEGVHLGIVADEHQESFGRGDFLVRNVVGADRSNGALLVGTSVEVGTTVQFHVRDSATADEDLRALLAGHRADGAVVFTCNGRGRHLFGQPHHDARLVADVTRRGAVAGMFCAGEVGPVGARSFLHGFTASVLLVHCT